MQHPLLISAFWAAALLGCMGFAQAQVPDIFKEANAKQGRTLIAEHKCDACHAQKWANDGKAVYRPAGRVNTPGLLRGMVEQCNLTLNSGLFPEDVTDIAAALNEAHYHFKK